MNNQQRKPYTHDTEQRDLTYNQNNFIKSKTENNSNNNKPINQINNNKIELYKSLSPKTNFQFTNNTSEDIHQQQRETNQKSLNDSRSSKNKPSVSSYLDRRHRESQEKINKLRHELNFSECQNITFKPKISENSKKIVEKLINPVQPQYDFDNIISNITPKQVQQVTTTAPLITNTNSIINNNISNNVNANKYREPPKKLKSNLDYQTRMFTRETNSTNGPVKLKPGNTNINLYMSSCDTNTRTPLRTDNNQNNQQEGMRNRIEESKAINKPRKPLHQNKTNNVNNSFTHGVDYDVYSQYDTNLTSHSNLNRSVHQIMWKDTAKQDLLKVVQNRQEILNEKNKLVSKLK